MDPPEHSADGSFPPTKRKLQLQGPRPPQLQVRKESHAIKKPPIAPHRQHPQPHEAAAAETHQPLIIYAVSPKIIHATATDFMSLVQRLTGPSSGDVSPAARLASIERTSPKDQRERDRGELANIDVMVTADDEVEVGKNPGILSPGPASLPPIPPGLFSPESFNHNGNSLLHDLSPSQSPFNLWNNVFLPSPNSNLFWTPMVSPSPSSFDLLNRLFDF
ncbi:protein MKS1-like [Diospyros lotus]|uniref:protein MKS1-like n=1 Tax=Diospyros lotus TaxID=55363 RepID=UPI00225A95A6|nr:protein MKS1-like [Diospyros lotus]